VKILLRLVLVAALVAMIATPAKARTKSGAHRKPTAHSQRNAAEIEAATRLQILVTFYSPESVVGFTWFRVH
jgi:hypothetical protein